MKRLLTIACVATLTLSGLMFVAPQPADAVTCSSVCNQVRRACQHSAKGIYKAARIECGQERVACHDDCAANAATCAPDCDSAQSACVSACGPDSVCVDGCNSAAAQCNDDCINCDANCDTAAGLCKVDVKSARSNMRDLCTGSRSNCNDQCVDPIDGQCVKGCTGEEHRCTADVKRDARSCKDGCRTGNARKACFNECKRAANVAASYCEDTAVLCYAECAGVVLAPPTTTTTQ